MGRHFERVATVYGRIRNTDPGIIKSIIPSLPCDKSRLNIADIGCGAGRYSKIIAARADSYLRLFCCDNSVAMLQQCRKRMHLEFPTKNTQYCLISANNLPFAYACFDAVPTFNAVHHFDLDAFIAAAARVLRPAGEFRFALEKLAKRLTSLVKDGKIEHTAENTMLLVRRI